MAEKAAPAATTPRATVAVDRPLLRLPPIRIGKVTLQGGDVNFTDLFIKPNYSANLTEIGGAVTGLSSQLDTTADVDLRGRFAGSAPVQIQGKINPLVRNLFLDLKANVRDIELGPFTPYSGKYVGYAIEKGKLTFNVAYKIENRKLAASNQIVVDQLTFGGKVESPQATKLPVHAGGRAAEGPQRRHRRQPADQRLAGRPQVQHRRIDHPGHRQSHHQGDHRPVRAARQSRGRRRRRSGALLRAVRSGTQRAHRAGAGQARHAAEGPGRPAGAQAGHHCRARIRRQIGRACGATASSNRSRRRSSRTWSSRATR